MIDPKGSATSENVARSDLQVDSLLTNGSLKCHQMKAQLKHIEISLCSLKLHRIFWMPTVENTHTHTHTHTHRVDRKMR